MKNDNVKENWLYYKKEIKNAIDDLKHKDTFYKQIPNLLTVSRVIGMIPVSLLLLTGNVIPGLFVLGLVMSTDFFDGKIARKYNLTSKFGADLDAVSDKIMALGLMLPLVLVDPVLIFNIILEGMISYTNVKGRLNGLDNKTIYIGKVKTCFLSVTLFLGYLSKFVPLFKKIFTLFSIFTAITQIKTCYDYFKSIFNKNDKIVYEKEEEDKKEEVVKREENFEELKKIKLINYENINTKERIKVRKRKK